MEYNRKLTSKIADYLFIGLIAVAGAAVIHFFMLPSNLSIGSIPGPAPVMRHFIALSVSTITLVMNGPLLIAGIFLVGSKFETKTIYSIHEVHYRPKPIQNRQ